MTQFFDDGRIGLSFEPSGGTIRFLPEPAADGHPTYCAVGTLTMLSATVAKLSALHGDVSARHMALMVRALDAMGVRALYVERTHGAIPLGARIESGDFAEWFRVDVAAAANRARERYNGVRAMAAGT